MLLGVHHTAIATKDIDGLSAFYCDALGMEQIAEGEWADSPENDAIVGLRGSAARFVLLHAGNQCIEMFQYLAPAGVAGNPDRPVCDSGITHFCLAVNDIEAEYARMSAAGMRFHAPPAPPNAEIPFRGIYGRDPDGNVIELLEITGETPFDYVPALARWHASA